MRQAISKLQKAKTCLHAFQAIIIFVAACITIALLTKPGSVDSRPGWFFGLCFLSIPALIYLVAVPMWTRTAKFAKAIAFVAVDAVFCILWLSAFASVLAWNRAGIDKGTTDAKLPLDQGNCTTFGYGPEAKCKLGYSAASVGVLIFVTFLLTTALSSLMLRTSLRDPQALDPWLAPSPYTATPLDSSSAPKDPIWDSSTRDIDGAHDSDDEEPVPGRPAPAYQALSGGEVEGRGWGPLDSHSPVMGGVGVGGDTEYRGAYESPATGGGKGYSFTRGSGAV
ncbi:hypothetical protein EJ06DRAFT_579355 [Trichodelitschia bisporula]|uniref:MARVEL domain-containing protein n=1 Tax=Trichodelitschia bisporula TaxID=703511 RepID=A0A6G1I920_9PEZI|nr:hypothetical protein EJ06DRAFT_579355 [Trichodelitschia bisporula]